MALSIGARTNKNLQAIHAIRAQRDFEFPPNEHVLNDLQIICECIEHGFRLGSFPKADDDFRVVGEWITNKLHDLAAVWPSDQPSVFVLSAAKVPTSEEFRMVLGGTTAVSTILVSAVTKFLESATRFETQRIASARVQLRNDDVDEETINKLVADKAALRRFIQDRRQLLMAQLSEIRRKMTANDPMDMPTQKELALYERHKAWFEAGTDLSTEYLPNDNAVPYALMAAEVMEVIAKHKRTEGGDLWFAYEAFCQVCMKAINAESASRAYLTLSNTPSFGVEGFDVGAAIREYVTDAERNKKAARAAVDPKLQTATQRGVRRLERLCAISVACKSPFTIYNLPLPEVAAQVVMLANREAQAKALLARSTMNQGVLALSDAESIMWNVCTGRHKLLVPNTGRNDLSVPIIVASVTSMSPTGMPRQSARSWSIRINLPPSGASFSRGPTLESLFSSRRRDEATAESKTDQPPDTPAPLFETADAERAFRVQVVSMHQEELDRLSPRHRAFADAILRQMQELADDDA